MVTWVKDNVLDPDEVWAHPRYSGLPRVGMEYPSISREDPNILFFTVRTEYIPYEYYQDRKVWMAEVVDTRRKEVRSVVPYTAEIMQTPQYQVSTILRF